MRKATFITLAILCVLLANFCIATAQSFPYTVVPIDVQKRGQQFTIDREYYGSTPFFKFVITDNGSAFDTTGWDFSLKYGYSRNANALVSFSGTNYVTVTNNEILVNGTTNFFFEARDNYYMALQGTHSSGASFTFAEGNMDVEYTPAGDPNVLDFENGLTFSLVLNTTFNAYTNSADLRFQALETQTNLIQSAVQPTDATYTQTVALAASALQSYTETDPVFSAWDKSAGVQISESQVTNLQSYLTAESDPAWHSGTGAIYSAIDLKQDASTAATDAELLVVSNLAASAVQDVNSAESIIGIGSAGQTVNVSADYLDIDAATTFFGSAALDYEIDEWGDIGLTYTNAVRLNPAVTITNDPVWTGWTTTGTLNTDTHEILLSTTNQYLLSPVYAAGIASVTADVRSSQNATAYIRLIYTNGVASSLEPPYKYADGQLYYRPTGVIPGASIELYVSNVTVVGYSDLSEARSSKEVSSLCVISQPVGVCDVANKGYVDTAKASAIASSAASLAAYAVNASKTVVCSRLRVGEEYAIEGDGELWQVAQGCSINGAGELVATEYGLGISRNGRQLLSFRDSASGVFITNANFTTWTIDVATNGVEATPFLEWSPSLTPQEWTTLPDTPTLTGGVYQFAVASPPTNEVGYVRAMQPVGTSAVMIDAQVLSLTDSTGGVWAVTISTGGVLTTTKE